MTAAARNIAICANKLIIFLRELLESLALCIAKASNFRSKTPALREDVHALGGLDRRDASRSGRRGILRAWWKAIDWRRFAAAKATLRGAAELQSAHEGRSPSAATELTRAFSIWFQAVNTAEKVHRVRRRRQYLSDSSTSQPGGIADCIARLQRAGVVVGSGRWQLIGSMSIEPVFTAHPTESTRRTILRKQQHIAQDLLERHQSRVRRAPSWTRLWARVRLEITSIWQTEEHPREGLTVVDEREHVLFYLIDILYRVVPLFYEEIEAALAQGILGARSKRSTYRAFCASAHGSAATWTAMPDVHGKTIRETLHRHQQVIVSTYFAECGQLAETLSQSANRVGISAALAARIESYSAILPGATGARAGTARSHAVPRVLRPNRRAAARRPTKAGPMPIRVRTNCLPTSALAAESLTLNRGRHAGYFLVRRFMRRVRTFGFHLATLDVIQHARVHDEVIAQGLGIADWPTLAPRGAAAPTARSTGARSGADRGTSMPSAGAACGCSRPSRRRVTSSAAAPSANTS